MAAPSVIVRLLWNAARASGAARAASRAGSSRELARNIVKLSHRLWKANRAIQQARSDDMDTLSRELDRENINFDVAGQTFKTDAGDFL